jgi:hypothetical protein
MRGVKTRDLRSRPTRFRGWILLHASSTFRRQDAGKEAGAALARGKILGAIRLEDCIEEGDGWTYVWKDPRRFRVAVPCRGHYSIPFYVPAKLVAGTPAARLKPGRLQSRDRRGERPD